VVEIDRRSSSPERLFRQSWLWGTVRQNEAPPAEFYCSLEEGVPAELGFLQRGNFLESNLSVFLFCFFVLGMDASHPEIYLSYTAIIPAALQETVGEAGIKPGTAALWSGETQLP
jgi:hypothetical protein